MIEIVGAFARLGFAVLGWAILHFLWQGALLGGVLEAVLLSLRRARPAVRERVALVGIAVLLLIFGATAVRIGQGVLAGIENALRVGSFAPPVDRSLAARIGGIAPFVGLVWLTLVVVQALLLARSLRALRRLRENAIALHPSETMTLVADLARRLGLRRTVPLCVSHAVDVPTLAGWRSPVILLPADAVRSLPADALAGVIAHELAHVRRRDAVTQVFLVLARALLFFHPCVHRLVRIAEHERERCCDDAALLAGTSPMHYARALVQLERLRPQPMSFAVAATRGPLRDRVQRIVHPVPALARGRAWSIAVAGVVFAGFVGHISLRASHAYGFDPRPVQHAATRFAVHRADLARHHHGHHDLNNTSSSIPDVRKRIVLRDVTKAPEPRAP